LTLLLFRTACFEYNKIMSDATGVIEKVEKRIVSNGMSDPFKVAVGSLRINESDAKNKDGAVDIGTILEKVYLWENENFEKVSPEEVESLEILSLVLETLNVGIERGKTGQLSDEDFADLARVETQRDVVRAVFRNFTPDNFPDGHIIRSFSLIASVFEDNLKSAPDRFFEQGLEKETGYWQGIMGMVTASLMFDRCGWKIGFANPWLDIKFNADIIATNPDRQRFTVDVAAKSVVDGGPLYRIEKSSTVRSGLLKEIPDLTGTITLNIPPLKSAEFSLEASHFYDQKRLSCGCPSEVAMEKFKRVINS
jgi:hypothetical protein